MCNPLWDNVFPPCTVIIGAQNDCDAFVTIDVGSGREPLVGERRFDLGPGADFRARVEVRSAGNDCTVFVMSAVEGPDPRGPDVCTMRVTPAHPFAFETIEVATR